MSTRELPIRQHLGRTWNATVSDGSLSEHREKDLNSLDDVRSLAGTRDGGSR
jgi:hypothetical protein